MSHSSSLSDAEIERIALGLIDRSLPKSEWTHAAHFAAALWLSRRRGPRAMTDMPRLIRSYNEATGVPNTESSGYHETITMASLRAAQTLLASRPEAPLSMLLDDLLKTALGRSDWLFAYWSKDVLMSATARTRWVEPDLRALPFEDVKGATSIEILTTQELGGVRARELRAWLVAAFEGDFADEDWAHAAAGSHVLLTDAAGIVSHAAWVPRQFQCGNRALRVGYVEAVATRANLRRRGHARRALEVVGECIARDYDIGALSTGLHDFYAPLGWRRWLGATYVNTPAGRRRTADEDDGVMVLLTPRSASLSLHGDIVADWRDGDFW